MSRLGAEYAAQDRKITLPVSEVWGMVRPEVKHVQTELTKVVVMTLFNRRPRLMRIGLAVTQQRCASTQWGLGISKRCSLKVSTFTIGENHPIRQWLLHLPYAMSKIPSVSC